MLSFDKIKCVCLRPHGQSEKFYGDRNRFEVKNMNDINIMDDITLTIRNEA